MGGGTEELLISVGTILLVLVTVATLKWFGAAILQGLGKNFNRPVFDVLAGIIEDIKEIKGDLSYFKNSDVAVQNRLNQGATEMENIRQELKKVDTRVDYLETDRTLES